MGVPLLSQQDAERGHIADAIAFEANRGLIGYVRRPGAHAFGFCQMRRVGGTSPVSQLMAQASPVTTARPQDREAALRLLFQHLETQERDRRVANALHMMELAKLDAEGLFIAHDNGVLCGSMFCMPAAGASGLIWPPQTTCVENAPGVADRLVNHTCDWLRPRGIKLAQALLSANETFLAPPLERNGFRHVTALWYMRRNMGVAAPSMEQRRLTLQAYDPNDPSVFSRTLLTTYEKTRDCPEVSGVRSIQEILDGHSADAGSIFSHWWLAVEGEQPVGVLLANESPEWESWEIAYIGIVPDARGRGLGRELMIRALVEAEASEVRQLTLCVDVRNSPAMELYRSLGFDHYDTREVYLAVLDTKHS